LEGAAVSSGESDAQVEADRDAALALHETSDDALVAARSEGAERAGEPVLIELSPAQVNQVVGEASEGGNVAVLLSGFHGGCEAFVAAAQQLENNPRASRSLLLGLLVFAVFPADGSYLGVTQVARILDMSASTTHRYIQTLLAVGLLERNPGTRGYRLVL
jgi:hypothetical protein